jgi:hypothetical protein
MTIWSSTSTYSCTSTFLNPTAATMAVAVSVLMMPASPSRRMASPLSVGVPSDSVLHTCWAISMPPAYYLAVGVPPAAAARRAKLSAWVVM